MKVFVSWSGDESKQVGKALSEWLPDVMHGIEPFFSPRDMDKGEQWAKQLFSELDATSVAIICLTKTNLASPWLAFEAAACRAKVQGRVCTFLYKVSNTDVTHLRIPLKMNTCIAAK